MDRHIRDVERLEHELFLVLSVGLGVHRTLSEHDGMFLRHNPEHVGENVVPIYHDIPNRDKMVRDGIALDPRLVTNIREFAREAEEKENSPRRGKDSTTSWGWST